MVILVIVKAATMIVVATSTNDDDDDDDCAVLGPAEVRAPAPDVQLQLHDPGVQFGRAFPDVQ